MKKMLITACFAIVAISGAYAADTIKSDKKNTDAKQITASSTAPAKEAAKKTEAAGAKDTSKTTVSTDKPSQGKAKN